MASSALYFLNNTSPWTFNDSQLGGYEAHLVSSNGGNLDVAYNVSVDGYFFQSNPSSSGFAVLTDPNTYVYNQSGSVILGVGLDSPSGPHRILIKAGGSTELTTPKHQTVLFYVKEYTFSVPGNNVIAQVYYRTFSLGNYYTNRVILFDVKPMSAASAVFGTYTDVPAIPFSGSDLAGTEYYYSAIGSDTDPLNPQGLGKYLVDIVDPRCVETYLHNVTSTNVSHTYYSGIISSASGFNNTTLTCFFPGTMIKTEDGEKKIEDIQKGDKIYNKFGKIITVKGLGTRQVWVCDKKDKGEWMWPICIPKNYFSENVPDKDTWCSPGHAIWVNGKYIDAYKLGLPQDKSMGLPLTYFNIAIEGGFDSFVANNMPVESYGRDNIEPYHPFLMEFKK